MEKFWLEDISELFKFHHLLPHKHLNIQETMNCLTRIVIIVFLILFIFNFSYDFFFLFISLFLIIIFYYLYKYNLKKNESFIIENYGKVESILKPPEPKIWNSYTNNMSFINGSYPFTNCCNNTSKNKTPLFIPIGENNINIFNTSQTTAYADQKVPLEETISTNQQLVGIANPKTLIKPIIPSPIYDFETWSPNDFIIPTGINDKKRQELYQNGYIYSKNYFNTQQPIIQENYQNETYLNNHPMYYNNSNYNIPYTENINTSCGYNPTNLKYNIPINYNATNQQLSNSMKEYNDNLFSIPIQPNIYTQSQVNQPYASMYNLGISQDQPFLPVISTNNNNQLKFTEMVPNKLKYELEPIENYEPLRNEIYDPRFTGYSSSDRSYVEKMTGQPRFYYDDVNQITQPNYITRNNLDIYGFASKIGSNDQSNVLQGDLLRQNANNNYIDSQLLYRTELQQRLLHKNNNRQWQQRQAPINTNSRAFKSNGTMSGAFN
jgi:hypothetical protein